MDVLYTGSNGGCATVRCLDNVYIKIVVQQDTAPDRTDPNGLLLHTKLVDCFGNQAMHRTMMAAGTIMSGHLFQCRRSLKNRLNVGSHDQSL
jgi:translation initiation factor 2 gamma subunit (eIF-2gamma)